MEKITQPNFWLHLPKPFFTLAPMADVTDAAFRRLIAHYGKPDVMYTEFVAADGLCSDIGRPKLLTDFIFTDSERPIVAQIFGSRPEHIFQAAQLVRDLGFDGLDINMGCPERNINKQCAGAALIKHPQLAQEIILAAQEGSGLPVSVKTRLGDRTNELATWLPNLLAVKPAAIAVHARTRAEMSAVPAHWDLVKQAVDIASGSGTLIIGNGDVADLADAKNKAEASGADGIMIGRGIFGNPWLFTGRAPEQITGAEKITVAIEHTKLYRQLFTDLKNFTIMRKHYKAYCHDFEGAKELRIELMQTTDYDQALTILNQFLNETK